jgi:cell shape-determining protein MreC
LGGISLISFKSIITVKQSIGVKKKDMGFMLPLVVLVSSFLLILLDNLNALAFLRDGVSFIFEPISQFSVDLGVSTKAYLNSFVRLSEFNREYNEMKVCLAEEQAENANYAVLYEENQSLKKQLEFGKEEERYVLAKSVSDKNLESLRINKGSEDGVVEGSVVSLGELFVGIVVKVDKGGALVRLPTNKSSFLEVIVVKSKDWEVGGRNILSRAVVSGAPEGIKIENIPMDANVADGDVVVVSDKRVGEYLVLGSLVSLSKNPATTSRFGYVSPLADYDGLMSVFVTVN